MRLKTNSWVKKAAGNIERIEACFSGLAYAPHSHDTYTLALTTHGVQSFNYRGALRHSLPGEVVILHPDELHDGQAGTDSPFAYRAITIDPLDVQQILQGTSLPFLQGGVTNQPHLVQIAINMLAELDRPLETLEQQDLIFAFANTLKQVTTNSIQHTRANYQAIKRVREYIDDLMAIDPCIALGISLDELADISNYSKWQVTRDFRALFGTTPFRYVMFKRLQKAKVLIEQGVPLAQVAVNSGFADQSHLTRQFKQGFGTTPNTWKQLHRGLS